MPQRADEINDGGRTFMDGGSGAIDEEPRDVIERICDAEGVICGAFPNPPHGAARLGTVSALQRSMALHAATGCPLHDGSERAGGLSQQYFGDRGACKVR